MDPFLNGFGLPRGESGAAFAEAKTSRDVEELGVRAPGFGCVIKLTVVPWDLCRPAALPKPHTLHRTAPTPAPLPPSPLQAFLNEAVAACTEGLIVKTLGDEYQVGGSLGLGDVGFRWIQDVCVCVCVGGVRIGVWLVLGPSLYPTR